MYIIILLLCLNILVFSTFISYVYTDERTGGGDGGGRVEDVTIFIMSDKNGQNQE